MRWIAALVSALVLALAHEALRGPHRSGGRPERLAGLARAVDGDTLDLQGRRIRLLGLDAPELHQNCEAAGRPVPCGLRAREALAALLREPVACSGRARDRYHRLLARCRQDGTGEDAGQNNSQSTGQDIGEALVRQGAAINLEGYAAAEAAARRDGLGIWQGRFEEPARWRREQRLGTADADDEADLP